MVDARTNVPGVSPNPVLQVGGVGKQFGGLLALSDVDLDILGGDRLAIIGPNGAGKTTLFNVITGELAPTSGRVRAFGRDLTPVPTHKRARMGLGRTYQVTNLFLDLTVEETIAIAIQGRARSRLQAWRTLRLNGPLRESINETVEKVGLSAHRYVLTSELSHGEQRQLEIAAALATNPRIVLFDEPAAGLSVGERGTIRDLIASLPRTMTILIIEHDIDLAFSIVDRVVCMDNGRVIASGAPDEMRTDERVLSVYLKTD